MDSIYQYARVYLPGPSYVQRASRVMWVFEAVYNTMLWRPETAVDLAEASGLSTVRINQETSVRRLGAKRFEASTGLFLFSNYQPELHQALKVKYAQPAGSIEIGFSGLGEAIDATAEVLDPLRRQERKERLRHAKEMNRVEETGAAYDIHLKSLEIADKQIAMILDLMHEGLLQPEEARRAIERLFAAQDHGAHILELERAKVVDIHEEPEREAEEAWVPDDLAGG